MVATFVIGPALLLGGGAAATLYWRKLKQDAIKEMDQRVDALHASYTGALVDLTNRERNRMLQYGQQILAPVFSQLTVLSERYQQHKTALQEKAELSRQLRHEIDNIEIVDGEGAS